MRFRASTSTWLPNLLKKHKILAVADPELIRRCDSCPINGASTDIQKTLGAVAEIMVPWLSWQSMGDNGSRNGKRSWLSCGRQ
jgi:hypothetical protein